MTCRGSRWNRVASSLRSIVISTSGFRAAILNLVAVRRREISGNVDSVISKSGLVENVGVEVKIASLFQAVQKLLPLPFFRPPSWISGGRRGGNFSGMAPLKSPYPKMGGG